MTNENADSLKHFGSWFRKRKKLTAIALFVIAVASVLTVTAFLLRHSPESRNLTSFTCHRSSSNTTFTIGVDVNLSDGMDSKEAVTVALAAFREAYDIASRGELVSTSSEVLVSEQGVYTVNIDLLFTSTGFHEVGHSAPVTRVTHEKFQAIINPYEKSVTCEF